LGFGGDGSFSALALQAARPLASPGEESGQPLQRLGRTLQARNDGLFSNPRFRVQPLDERDERLAADGIVRAVRNTVTKVQIGVEQEDELILPTGPLDDGRDDERRLLGDLAA
jgi:hypothetical protein